jgi:hypothetical protein
MPRRTGRRSCPQIGSMDNTSAYLADRTSTLGRLPAVYSELGGRSVGASAATPQRQREERMGHIGRPGLSCLTVVLLLVFHHSPVLGGPIDLNSLRTFRGHLATVT